MQIATGDPAVLLVAYDTAAAGPLMSIHQATGTLGGALVLTKEATGGRRIAVRLDEGAATPSRGPLSLHEPGNAMHPMMPVFDALAHDAAASLCLEAGAGRALLIDIGPA